MYLVPTAADAMRQGGSRWPCAGLSLAVWRIPAWLSHTGTIIHNRPVHDHIAFRIVSGYNILAITFCRLSFPDSLSKCGTRRLEVSGFVSCFSSCFVLFPQSHAVLARPKIVMIRCQMSLMSQVSNRSVASELFISGPNSTRQNRVYNSSVNKSHKWQFHSAAFIRSRVH